MPTTFGVSPAGFVRKTEVDIVAELEADELSEVADDLDVSSDQIAGQWNGIFARQLGIAWEQLEVLYHGNDPDVSEDRLLEILGKLTGTFRRGNTPSEVTLTCDLDIDTVLRADEHFSHVENRPDIRWTPLADYTATTSGMQPVVFRSELTGLIEGLAGTINEIASPAAGWHSCVNADDAELGKEVDTDPEFRLRREKELAAAGSTTTRAIKAEISRHFREEIQTLEVYENEGDLPDEEGRPPHSVEALIFDGEVPTVDNDELAQVIQNQKAGGIQAFGNTVGIATVTIDGVATPITIGFSRAEQLTTYLILNVSTVPGYVGDAAVREHVAKTANEDHGPGDDVIALAVRAMPLALQGVHDVTSIQLGFAPAPANTVNLPVSVRQIARFSTSRIIVNST